MLAIITDKKYFVKSKKTVVLNVLQWIVDLSSHEFCLHI